MERKSIALVDEHLQSIGGMQEVGTDDFFYTRLKARMQREKLQQGWSFPLKPVWVAGTLAFLLAVNSFMLSKQFKTKAGTSASSLQSFAESYDQTISSSY